VVQKVEPGHLETNQPDLLEDLSDKRDAQGFETWEDTDGHDVIKNYLLARGFVRVAAD